MDVNNEQIKSNLISALSDLYHLAKNEEYLEDKLSLYQFVASCYWHNYSNSYSHPELEQDLLIISNEIIDFSLPNYNGNNDILHVMTEAYFVGGHTRVVENWIKSSPEYKHSVILNNGDSNIPDFLKEAVDSSNGDILLNTEKGFVNKARYLAKYANRFKYVILHHHPHDILPLLSFGNQYYNRPTLFYNHADHVWGCGYSVCNMVLGIRENSDFNCEFKGIGRNLSAYVGIPVLDNIEMGNLNISVPRKSFVTMASSYKFLPTTAFNFQDFVIELLDKYPDFSYDIIGVDENDVLWSELLIKFPIRLRLHGVLSSQESKAIINGAMLYIDSFPFVSFTSLIESVITGVPAVSLRTPVSVPPCYQDIVCDDMNILFARIDEIIKYTTIERNCYLMKIIDRIIKYNSFISFSDYVAMSFNLVTNHANKIKLIKIGNYLDNRQFDLYSNFLFELLKQHKFRFDYSLFIKLSFKLQKQICSILDKRSLLVNSCQLVGVASILDAMDGGVAYSQLFIATLELPEFNGEHYFSQVVGLNQRYIYSLSKYPNITRLRFDPINQPAKVKLLSAQVKLTNGENYPLELVWHNADLNADIYDFKHDDPQFVFDIPIAIQADLVSVEFVVDITPYNKWEILGLLSVANYETKLVQNRLDQCEQFANQLNPWNNAQVCLHYDTGSDFNGTEFLFQPAHDGVNTCEFDLSGIANLKGLRLDPVNLPARVKLLSAQLVANDGTSYDMPIKWHSANDINQDEFGFYHDDPIMIFDLTNLNLTNYSKLSCEFQLSLVNVHELSSFILNQLTQLSEQSIELQNTESKLINVTNELTASNERLNNTQNELIASNEKLNNTKNELAAVYQSQSWKITKPLRKFCRLFKG
mgnify:CR=1 FL=1